MFKTIYLPCMIILVILRHLYSDCLRQQFSCFLKDSFRDKWPIFSIFLIIIFKIFSQGILTFDTCKVLKSLNPIYFVKIRLPDFLCNEFLIKMYRLLQNYTFDIYTLSKIILLL